jgi:hypothetical protein
MSAGSGTAASALPSGLAQTFDHVGVVFGGARRQSLSRDLRRPATSLSVKLPRGETVRGKRVLTPKTPELKPIRPNEGRYRFLIFAQEAVVRRAQHVVNIDAVIGERKQTTPK